MLPHPTHFDLEAFARQALNWTHAEEILSHLDHCEACSQTVESLETEYFKELIPNPEMLNLNSLPVRSEEIQCQRMVDAICDTRFSLIGSKQIPKHLGHYELQAKIGEGGMGVVYLGKHTKLLRTVAIKLIQINRLLNPRAADRFRREMIAAGRLCHPNIVLVMDAGEDSGLHYLVMEYLDGKDLSQLCQLGQLAVADACEIIRQAAVGVQKAHDESLIHRDIKPSNLFLARADGVGNDPVVKLLDLGLAQVESASLSLPEVSWSGQVLGTLAYMAPEQLRNSSRVDHRVDIYSLGATMFKFLSGHSLLEIGHEIGLSDSRSGTAQRSHLSIQSFREDVPAGVVRIVERAIHRDPDQRFSSAEEFAKALEPYCQNADLTTLLDREPCESSSELSESLKFRKGQTLDYAAKRGVVSTFTSRKALSVAIACASVLCIAVAFVLSGMQKEIPAEIDFVDPVRLSELSSAYIDEVTFVSPDGHLVLVQSNRADSIIKLNNRRYQIYTASRPHPAARFSMHELDLLAAPNQSAFSVRSGVLSPDQLELFYFSHDNDNGGRETFFWSTRQDINSPFSKGRKLGEASLAAWGSGCYHSPQWMSPDGLRLYYTFEIRDVSGNALGSGGRRLFMIEREHLEDDFGTPSEYLFAELNQQKVESASLSADELQIYFSSDRPGGKGGLDLWFADRKSTDVPFSNPVNMRSINTKEHETSPRIFGDTLLFSRGVDSDLDVFSTTRRRDGAEALRMDKVTPTYVEVGEVRELNSDAAESITWVADDELSVCLSSQRLDPIRKEHSLFFATRDSTDMPFSIPDPKIFAIINESEYNTSHAVLSADQLELFYSGDSTPYGSDSFLHSIRSSTDEPFPIGELVMEASIARMGEHGVERPRWLSPDGKRLYYDFYQRPNEICHSFVIERESVESEFGKPTDAIFRNLNGRWKRFSIASLSPDELYVYFHAAEEYSSHHPVGIYVASRSRLDEPFSNPVPIASINSRGDVTNPRVSGTRLYFGRSINGQSDIFVAKEVLGSSH